MITEQKRDTEDGSSEQSKVKMKMSPQFCPPSAPATAAAIVDSSGSYLSVKKLNRSSPWKP
ncbi:Transmembrane protein 8B [Gossypium australe]|uniref:Transmembrane protein 8B n=1 Tax=Gossypium australe TaxID=47621 RepID=A0A5B6VJ96_9ROSI|nr:Transmembrane protein 8B [Gossypium australe]